MSLEFAHPNHRHAVRRGQHRAIQDVAEYGVVLSFADPVYTGDRDITASTLANGIEQKLARTILIEDADAYAEDVYFRYFIHRYAKLIIVGTRLVGIRNSKPQTPNKHQISNSNFESTRRHRSFGA